MFIKTGLAYLNLPRNGDISITLGVTQGKKERQTHSPERVESQSCTTPAGADNRRVFRNRGLHPRLLKSDPFRALP